MQKVQAKPHSQIIPAELKNALAADAKVKEQFDSLSPSCKREYVEYITSAKREETRMSRVAKTLQMLAAGKKRMKD
jgi:uncharacterized protein YdeI (YjbR/CyaY-like superfamily)